MFKCKAALRATRSAQTIPARRLTTSLRPLRFSADPSKVTSSGCLLPQKVYSDRPLRFLRILRRKCHCPKQAVKRNWRGLWAFGCENFPAAPTSCSSYIFTDFRLEKAQETAPFRERFCGDGGWRRAPSEGD